jgi:negative regulator of sigma E activity
MTDKMNEQLSAYLDDAGSAHELDNLIKESRSQAVHETIQRYQLIGSVLSGDKNRYAHSDIAQRVMAAIENEQLHRSGSTSQSVNWLTSLLSVSWFKPLAGVAVAGFVATITILVSQGQFQPGQSGQIQTLAGNQQNYTPLKIELAADIPALNEPEAQRRQQVNNYLVNHSRSAAGSSYQGMVPYVRAVAFEPAETLSGERK